MPGIDGYEVAAQLRSRLSEQRPILVALTGWGHEEDRKKTRAAGFDRHLVKPLDPDDIARLLAELARSPGNGGRA
jgi:CheY-like chemotaxis protein